MVVSKQYNRVNKTSLRIRKNRVFCTVREHYLRADIYCGIQECPAGCEGGDDVLDEKPEKISDATEKSVYIIPDCDVILKQVGGMVQISPVFQMCPSQKILW